MSALPERPELHPEIAVRQHLVDGETRVSMTHTQLGHEIVIGPREWDTLRCADGSRDLVGIQRALSARGRRVSLDSIRLFLTQLHEMRMLSPGTGPTEQVDSDAQQSPHRNPLRQLPGYHFRCEGQGHCCETYTSILFTPLEELRAREACPEIMEGDYRRERLFSPERGVHDIGASCVTRVNGACAYLDANAGCQIHDRRGSDAKPKGCQLFPLAYVDDGAHINLTVRPECACVFDSLELTPSSPPAGAPPDTPTHLPDWIPVERLPERIIWSTGETVTREAFRERRDAWLHHASPDIARALWEASGNSDDASYTATDSPRSYLKNLHARLGVHQMKRLEWDAPEGHMMRSLGRWRDALGAWLNGEQPLPMPHRDEYERFAFRALAMGTTLTQADSVMNAYQRIALLIWAARILANEPAGRESVSHPLALVFSMTTALGLWETLLS